METIRYTLYVLELVILKNDASWECFLKKLHGAIGHVDDLVVVLDRHNNIEKAVRKVFPHASHGVCTYHMK